MPPRRELQPNFRALTVFDTLPAGHVTFRVTGDGSAPHLREGEFAVVDTADREPAHGELFVLQSSYGDRRRTIVQTRSSYENITAPGSKVRTLCWWTSDLRRFPGLAELDALLAAANRRGEIPVIGGLSDGPRFTDALRRALIGRVVGVAFSPLEEQLAPQAGWQDEEFGNRQFDSAAYVNALLAAGYRVAALLDAAGDPDNIVIGMPERRQSEAEMASFIRANETFSGASRAPRLAAAECVRRGLVACDRGPGGIR